MRSISRRSEGENDAASSQSKLSPRGRTVFEHQGNEFVVYDIADHCGIGRTDILEDFEVYLALRKG